MRHGRGRFITMPIGLPPLVGEVSPRRLVLVVVNQIVFPQSPVIDNFSCSVQIDPLCAGLMVGFLW